MALLCMCVCGGGEGGNLGRLKVFVLGLGRWEGCILCWLLGLREKNVAKSENIGSSPT